MEKVLLNRFDDPKMSKCKWVGKGDKVVASYSAEDYSFTEGKEYEIQDIKYGEYLVITNDKGETDDYSVEYFR